MKMYKCDICGREVEYPHMLKTFPAYNLETGLNDVKDHCPICLKRTLAMFTVMAMTQYPRLEFDEDSTLADVIHELRDKDSFLTIDVQKHIADRDTDFKVVFTKRPFQSSGEKRHKEGEE